MAKINTSAIEGYEAMTAEEKLAALEALDIPDVDKIKSALDKATSEASSYKKQLRERMTEEEARAAKDAEDRAAIQKELEELRAEKVVGQHTAKFLGLGYDEKLARETATALASGEHETVFRNHAKFLADREKALRAEILKATPTPPAGDGAEKKTREDFAKMTLAEKQKFARENPEAFNEFYGGN